MQGELVLENDSRTDSAPITERPTSTLPTLEPGELPDYRQAPEVVKARDLRDKLTRELEDGKRERQTIERELNVGRLSETAIKARALLREGSDKAVSDRLNRLAALREIEPVRTEAVALANGEFNAALDAAKRAYSKAVTDATYLPAAREFARQYIQWAAVGQEFRNLTERVRAAGYSVDDSSPVHANELPLGGPMDALTVVFRRMIGHHALTRDDVEAVFPDLFAGTRPDALGMM